MNLPIASGAAGLEAGLDEAGRGCLAGPVVAAAVILPADFALPGVNDSKKLTHRQRMALRPLIMERSLAWGVGMISAGRIDEVNILNATFEAMHQAVQELALTPDLLAIDGNRFTPYPGIRHQCFVKGDTRFQHIAAASILAKTFRDEVMSLLDQDYPMYH
ncbi:MAG: ribonuclease HII, partial [Bacteroidota bacterium]